MTAVRRRPPVPSHRRSATGFGVVAIVLALIAQADAHPISVVVESAYVERDKVSIEVECFAEDLYFYHNLRPNDKNKATASSLRDAAVKHGPLLLERLPVYDAGGHRIDGGRIVSVTGD